MTKHKSLVRRSCRVICFRSRRSRKGRKIGARILELLLVQEELGRNEPEGSHEAYGFPGGGLKKCDISYLDAAVREMLEETNKLLLRERVLPVRVRFEDRRARTVRVYLIVVQREYEMSMQYIPEKQVRFPLWVDHNSLPLVGGLTIGRKQQKHLLKILKKPNVRKALNYRGISNEEIKVMLGQLHKSLKSPTDEGN